MSITPRRASTRIRALLLGALVLLGGAVTVVASQLHARTESRTLVIRSYDALLSLEHVRATTLLATQAQQHFVFLGEGTAPERFARTAAEHERAMARVREMIEGSLEQRRGLDSLRSLTSAHFAAIRTVIRAMRQGDTVAARRLAASPTSAERADSVLTLVSRLAERERRVLDARSESLADVVRRANAILIGIVLLAGLLAAAALVYGERVDVARRIAEGERDERDARIDMALDAARMGWWSFDTETQRPDWARQAGPLFGEAPGWTPKGLGEVMDRVHPDDRALVATALRRIEESPDVATVRYRTRWKDGTIRWLSASLRGERDRFGRVVRLVGMTHDTSVLEESLAALAASQARLVSVLDAMSDAVTLLDGKSFRILLSNPAAVRILGLSDEQVQGQVPLQLDGKVVDQLEIPIAPGECPAARALREGRAVHLTIGLRRDDGTRAWLQTSAVPLMEPGAAPHTRVLVTFTDITALRRAQEEVARLSLIAEQMSDMAMITEMTGSIVWANEAFTRATGFSLADIVGRPPTLLDDTPETDPRERARLEASVADLRPFTGEFQARRKNGQLFWVELTITPVFGSDGTPQYVLSVARDITERRSLLRSLAQRDRTIEASVDGLAMHDESFRLLYANDAHARIFGFPSGKSMVGRLLTEFHSREEFERVMHESLPVLTADGTWRGEVITRRPDGLELPVGLASRLLPDGTVVSVTRDLRAEKEAERELRTARDAANAANRAKSAFLARMSHELRTPLNAIIGFTKLVAKNRDATLGARDLELLTRVSVNGERLLGIVNDILDLAKVESGRMDLAIAPTELASLVAETVAHCEGYPRKPGVQLRMESSCDPGTIETDAGKLRQVLMNLISNALKFTERGEVVIRVVCGPGSDVVTLEVTDTGRGIPANRLDAIFEPFEQADASTAREFGGTGLGLPISRAICEALGAVLEVESTVGAGTTFRFALARRVTVGAR